MVEKSFNYKKLCVRLHKNEYIYPKTIPKERGPLATQIACIICAILFFVQYCLSIVLSIFLQLLYRIILMCEEFNHLISRYEGNITTLVKDTITFQLHVFVIFFLCTIYLVYYFSTEKLDIGSMDHPLKLGCFLTNIYLIEKLLKLDAGPLNDSLWVAANNGLDYGSGMAYSFFHGYLNLVLPKTGREDKNLKEIMQDYEDKNKVKFAFHKLFILIPKSMRCFVSLKNEYSPSIEESSGLSPDNIDKWFICTVAPTTAENRYICHIRFVCVKWRDDRPVCYLTLVSKDSPVYRYVEIGKCNNSLEEKVITVAGVQNRVYKNAVYKIVSQESGKKKSYIYVSAEYATPLKTFKDVFDNRGEHSDYYNKHKKDIILQFYLTLGKVLEEKGLSQFCELIYYEDSFQKNGAACYYDVGEIIQERLKELKKKQE